MLAAGCGETPFPPSGNSPRPESYTFCPTPSIGALPARFSLRDRTLENLGQNLMGRSATYGYGRRHLTIFVGYDALDAYDDLDFHERVVAVAGRQVTLATPGAVAETHLRFATWDDKRFGPGCQLLTIVAKRLTEGELLDVVGTVTVG